MAEQMDKILHFESVKSELMEKLTYLERRLDRNFGSKINVMVKCLLSILIIPRRNIEIDRNKQTPKWFPSTAGKYIISQRKNDRFQSIPVILLRYTHHII